MSHPYIQEQLARERHNTMLANAEAVRLARQARAHRRRNRAPAVRGSLFRWIPGWRPTAWGQLLTRRPGYGPEATGRRGALEDGPAPAK